MKTLSTLFVSLLLLMSITSCSTNNEPLNDDSSSELQGVWKNISSDSASNSEEKIVIGNNQSGLLIVKTTHDKDAVTSTATIITWEFSNDEIIIFSENGGVLKSFSIDISNQTSILLDLNNNDIFERTDENYEIYY